MRSLVAEAIEADEQIERTGEVYRADEVYAWAERLASGPASDDRSRGDAESGGDYTHYV